MPDTQPQFALIRTHWTAKVILPSWKGFQNRSDPYGSLKHPIASDGEVEIVFAPEGRGVEPLNSSEIKSLVWFLENAESISEALIESLLKGYPALQERYKLSWGENAEVMPDIKTVDDLRTHIGLNGVFVHQVQKGGIPYVGFSFGCTWEEEHGLGALMHGTRTVDIGGADTSFLLWIAEEDGGV